MIRFAFIFGIFLPLCAAEHRGTVTFGGLPVPGVSVTAWRAETALRTITDGNGSYLFPDLANGTWTVRVEMQVFVPASREIVAGPGSVTWELQMVPPRRSGN